MVYNRLQSSFMSLAWPWSGRSLPNGNQWECWDPGLGRNVVRLPVFLPPSAQPQTWQVDILSHGWLAGQLQVASWLAGWLTAYQTKCQPYPPPGRHLVAMCIMKLVTWTLQAWCEFGQMSSQLNIMSDICSNWKSCPDIERWLTPMDDFYTMKDLSPGRLTI